MVVEATDSDCGVNAMVNYTLAGGQLENEQFLVRSDTGDICVRSPLDRETVPYLELPVIATDRGTEYPQILISLLLFDTKYRSREFFRPRNLYLNA
ncbi:Protein dachsous [Temnothorax longispinosus]|uniref:Protein dachsous n=1 Tax=Temnothorax longispinosus TaxID=300112 RepID=A0A4S2L1J5_9HYME|nr:Protein dachsous [Temnothorax longispinosus]